MNNNIHNFVIHIATVNGTGSMTANGVLVRAFHYLGIPCISKNFFPSNIKGLPTWFTIRLNKKGYRAYSSQRDLLVAYNLSTLEEDVAKMPSNGIVILDEAFPHQQRDDLTYIPVPFKSLVNPIAEGSQLRTLLANMVYVAVVGRLLGVPLSVLEKALTFQLKGKAKALSLNYQVLKASYAWAEANIPPQKNLTLSPGKPLSSFLIEGNTAAALGAMFGGVNFVSWYPITPSSSFAESLTSFMERYRKDPENQKATFAIIQAEDELAAIGMAIGAGWSGARAMTATSGPGISLMAEYVGLAYFAEVPVVIMDVQRVGPSTGLPTRTSQGDLSFLATLSHGDTLHPILIPHGPEELFSMTARSFDLANRLQGPVFILSDLDLGMNIWPCEGFTYPDQPLDPGKMLSEKELETISDYGRYVDVDGDGIPYRVLPGTPLHKGAFLTRGSGHDAYGKYSEAPEVYSALMDRLRKKLFSLIPQLPKPEIVPETSSRGVIAYGSSHWAVVEGLDRLKEEGIQLSYLRLRSFPFHNEVKDFIQHREKVVVVEQNRDGQMRALLQSTFPDIAMKLDGITHYTGEPLDVEFVYAALKEVFHG